MSLKHKVLTGVKWVAIANVFTQILSVVSIIIFARLLSPDDFGTFAILMIFIGFLGIFSDMGTSAALIHIKNPSNSLLSSIFYFNIFIGFSLAVILMLLSESIATFFDNPQIRNMLYVISFNFIIVSFGVVQKAILQKNMNFKNLSLIQSVAMFLGVFIGILSAFSGLGVYSLIIQTLTTSIIGTILIWLYTSWRPEWIFSLKEIKQIWSYTANLSAFEFINYFATNADNFLIGKYLSTASLGVYSLAYKIMLYPLQNISRILMKVLFPAFSQLQDDNQAFKNAYLRVIFYISLITFPMMTGLMATNEILVDVLFGDKWQGLALLLLILAPSGMLRSIYTTVGIIFMAKGNTAMQFKLGTVNAILTVLGFIIGLKWGVIGIALSYLIVNLIMFYPIFHISWGQIELNILDGLRKISPIFFISVFMGLFVYMIDYVLFYQINNMLIRLILMILSGAHIIFRNAKNYTMATLKTLLKDIKK